MKYFFLLARRLAATLACKVSAFLAVRTKRAWALSWLDSSIRSLQRALSAEARFCMGKTTRWQKKAGNCLAYYHKAGMLIGGKDRESGEKEKKAGKTT